MCGHNAACYGYYTGYTGETVIRSTIQGRYMLCDSYICHRYNEVEARHVEVDAVLSNDVYLCNGRKDCKNTNIDEEPAVCSIGALVCYVSHDGYILGINDFRVQVCL